mmetsp:Transcript_80847/g.232292  ORF Transcript_80847/g.232292 Transcript_80847/m.232292 type:complete len:341 (+) Transcript_80847:47-1069(+)
MAPGMRWGRHRRSAVLVLAAACATALLRGALEAFALPAAPPLPRRSLLGAAGSALGTSAGLQVSPALASEMFGLDVSFLDPPAPPDVAAPPADAEVLPSGLVTKLLLRPQCALAKSMALNSEKCVAERARPFDKVLIDYTGWKPNGKMFDSSRLEKKLVRVNSVMPGWTEGLQMMAPGETRRFWVPPALAFGDAGDGAAKPGGPLVFDIEMYSVERQPKPPDELKAPPGDVKVTASGLSYKQIKPGTGQTMPTPDSNITALYNGWSSNGDLILSTSFGGQSDFWLKEVPIKGLLEGVQLMREGETFRFWVPANLAFGEKPEGKGLPGGTLVFDFRLSSIN